MFAIQFFREDLQAQVWSLAPCYRTIYLIHRYIYIAFCVGKDLEDNNVSTPISLSVPLVLFIV